jgi:hypothetical protein
MNHKKQKIALLIGLRLLKRYSKAERKILSLEGFEA